MPQHELLSMAKAEVALYRSPLQQRASIAEQWRQHIKYTDYSLGDPVARIKLLTEAGRKRIGLSTK